MKKLKLYLYLAAILLLSIVIFQNTAIVETKVLFMTITMPRAALLGVTLLAGIAIGVGLTLNRIRPRTKSPPK